jgi:hypothetical protein
VQLERARPPELVAWVQRLHSEDNRPEAWR